MSKSNAQTNISKANKQRWTLAKYLLSSGKFPDIQAARAWMKDNKEHVETMMEELATTGRTSVPEAVGTCTQESVNEPEVTKPAIENTAKGSPGMDQESTVQGCDSRPPADNQGGDKCKPSNMHEIAQAVGAVVVQFSKLAMAMERLEKVAGREFAANVSMGIVLKQIDSSHPTVPPPSQRPS